MVMVQLRYIRRCVGKEAFGVVRTFVTARKKRVDGVCDEVVRRTAIQCLIMEYKVSDFVSSFKGQQVIKVEATEQVEARAYDDTP